MLSISIPCEAIMTMYDYVFSIKVSNKVFVKEESAGEMGTSFAEMNRSDNSNAKKGPSKDFNAYKDFHESETIASILAAWMEFSGMDSIEGIAFFLLLLTAGL